MQQGVAQGRLDGERALVLYQMQHRFGELPAALRLCLKGASQAELEHLAERVLDATGLLPVSKRAHGGVAFLRQVPWESDPKVWRIRSFCGSRS
jgi:hypothetical protein